MASSSFDFDRALAYALSCVKDLVLRINRWRLSSSCLKGRTFSCGSLPAMESPYTSYCPSYLTSSWVGPTLTSLAEVSFLLFLPLCLIGHEYTFRVIYPYFHRTFYGMFYCWIYDSNRHVHIQSITRPYFSPAVKRKIGLGTRQKFWIYHSTIVR